MTGLTCRELVEQVSGFLDGALDPAASRQLTDHLLGCVGCRQYLHQVRQTTGLLADLPPDQLPAAVRDGVLAAFHGSDPAV